MKTILLSLLALVGLTLATPEAQARDRRHHHHRHHHHGYYHRHHHHHHYGYSRYYRGRPVYYRSYAPVYYRSRPVRHYYYDDRYRYGYRRPGVSFSVRF